MSHSAYHNLELDSCWLNLSGTLRGNPARIRLNEGVVPLQDDPAWAVEMLVTVHVNDVGDDGLPRDIDEYTALDALEDLYRDALQRGGRSVLALVITTDGIRDLIFYTSDPDAAIKEFEERLKPATTTHPVEFTIRPNAWELYRRFA